MSQEVSEPGHGLRGIVMSLGAGTWIERERRRSTPA